MLLLLRSGEEIVARAVEQGDEDDKVNCEEEKITANLIFKYLKMPRSTVPVGRREEGGGRRDGGSVPGLFETSKCAESTKDISK